MKGSTVVARSGGRWWGGRAVPAVLAIALSILAVMHVPAGAAPPAPPTGLSVGLSDDRTQVESKMDVTYTATLTNGGTKPVSADLVLTVPTYVKIVSAQGATTKGSQAAWAVTVDPGRTVKQRATARIGAVPKSELRLTGLVSVYRGAATGMPLIRSADSDPIKGVQAPRLKPGPGTTPEATAPVRHHLSALPVAGVLGVGLLAVITTVLVMRRRGRLAAGRARYRQQLS